MLEISYPIAFAFVLLAFIFMLFSYTGEKYALNFPNILQLKKAKANDTSLVKLNSSFFNTFILFSVYLLVVLSLSRPILIQEPVINEKSLRDVLICVDLSSSMEAKDFKSSNGKYVDRLQAQKEVLSEFIQKRSGDNIGLIFYGSAAFIQSPFTSDTNATIQLLNEAQIGMAGPKTVIGDAIGLGIKLFDESKIKERLIILMSDGTDTGSKVDPYEAAKIASANDLKVITIAVGDPEAEGNEKVDIKTLQEVAQITKSEFYFASDRESLDDVYVQIDELHPKKVKKETYRSVKELYRYPLLFAFGILMLYSLGALLFKRDKHV